MEARADNQALQTALSWGENSPEEPPVGLGMGLVPESCAVTTGTIFIFLRCSLRKQCYLPLKSREQRLLAALKSPQSPRLLTVLCWDL